MKRINLLKKLKIYKIKFTKYSYQIQAIKIKIIHLLIRLKYQKNKQKNQKKKITTMKLKKNSLS